MNREPGQDCYPHRFRSEKVTWLVRRLTIPGFPDPRHLPLSNVTNYTAARSQLLQPDSDEFAAGHQISQQKFPSRDFIDISKFLLWGTYWISVKFKIFGGKGSQSTQITQPFQFWNHFLNLPLLLCYGWKKTTTESARFRKLEDQSRDRQLDALSQWCSWWHSTGEGVSGPEIQESSSISRGKVFRGCVEMCR